MLPIRSTIKIFLKLKILEKYPELADEFKILNEVGVTPNSKFNKVKHLTPMYSLSNGFNDEDILNFPKANKIIFGSTSKQ